VRRDTYETRARLLGAAEELFATRGIFRTTLREITEAAGQRNASAVSYHFGSRGGLLDELLRQRGVPLDQHRGQVLDQIGPEPSTRQLITVLLTPLIGCLHSQEGRYYLRIVAQLSGQFSQWREEAPHTGPNLRRVLADLEQRAMGGTPEASGERLIALMLLLTAVMAERARQVDSRERLPIDERGFEANVADMLVGLVEAPAAVAV